MSPCNWPLVLESKECDGYKLFYTSGVISIILYTMSSVLVAYALSSRCTKIKNLTNFSSLEFYLFCSFIFCSLRVVTVSYSQNYFVASPMIYELLYCASWISGEFATYSYVFGILNTIIKLNMNTISKSSSKGVISSHHSDGYTTYHNNTYNNNNDIHPSSGNSNISNQKRVFIPSKGLIKKSFFLIITISLIILITSSIIKGYYEVKYFHSKDIIYETTLAYNILTVAVYSINNLILGMLLAYYGRLLIRLTKENLMLIGFDDYEECYSSNSDNYKFNVNYNINRAILSQKHARIKKTFERYIRKVTILNYCLITCCLSSCVVLIPLITGLLLTSHVLLASIFFNLFTNIFPPLIAFLICLSIIISESSDNNNEEKKYGKCSRNICIRCTVIDFFVCWNMIYLII